MLYKSARGQWVNSLEAGDGIFFDRLLGGNTMPADALAPKVASTSAVHDIGCVGQTAYVGVPKLNLSIWIKPNPRYVSIVNTFFIIFKNNSAC